VKNRMKLIPIVSYFAAFFFISTYISNELTPSFNMSIISRFFYIFTTCVLLYFGSFVLCKIKVNKQKIIMHRTFQCFFVLYIILLITFTFLEPVYGRDYGRFVEEYQSLKSYLETNTNLIPFETILLYWNGYIYGVVSLSDYLLNMLGNLILLMPTALFFPVFYKRLRKLSSFIIDIFIFAFSIEFLQLLTMCGSFDIDDILLNMVGAILVFCILKNAVVDKLMCRISFDVISIRENKHD